MSVPAKGAVLVTGGAGFIGSNLADALAAQGRRVIVYDVLARPGVERNLAWLQARHPQRIEARIADIRDRAALGAAVAEAEAVFHFAAQVAVTTSLAAPGEDFEVNLAGTFNLLEALRRKPTPTPLVFASTNKVYGDLADAPLALGDDGYAPVDDGLRRFGVDETRPLDFHTPYGCSKGAADQYVLDYARSYDLPTCVLRMSCIYGPGQMGTEDQGWVAHFILRALAGQPITLFGDGRQVRDILHVRDAVGAYLAAWRRIEAAKGRAFNLGGGPGNAVSLRGMLAHVERLVGRPLHLEHAPWRAGDQRYFVADARAARRELHLPPPLDWREGVAGLVDWLREHGEPRPSAVPRPVEAAA